MNPHTSTTQNTQKTSQRKHLEAPATNAKTSAPASQNKILFESEALYSSNEILQRLFPECANPKKHQHMKQIITMQQIYEINLEYRIDTAKSFQTAETLRRFNLCHNLSLTTQQIMGYALSPYLIFSSEHNQLNLLHRFFAPETTSPISTTSQHTLSDSSPDISPQRDLAPSFALSTHSPYGQISDTDQYADFPCGQPTQAQSPTFSTPTQLPSSILIQQQISHHLLPKQKLDQLCTTSTSKITSSISPPTNTYTENASSISYNSNFLNTAISHRHIPIPPPPPPLPPPPPPKFHFQQCMPPPHRTPLPLSIPQGFHIPKQQTHFHSHHIIPSINQIENTQYLASISLHSQQQQPNKRLKQHHQQS